MPRSTIYDRGHDAARKIIADYKFIPNMLNKERADFNLYMLRSLLYTAWRMGYKAKSRDVRKRGVGNA